MRLPMRTQNQDRSRTRTLTRERSGAPTQTSSPGPTSRAPPIIQAIGDRFAEDQGISVAVQQLDLGQIRDSLVTQGSAGEGADIIIGAHDRLGSLVTNGVVEPIELGDLAQTALALVEAGEAEIPLALQVGADDDPYHLYPSFTSFGTSVFDCNDDGTYNPDEPLVDSPEGLAFAEALADLSDRGALNTDLDFGPAVEAFASGNAPYTISGPWNVGAYEQAGVPFVVEAIPSLGGEDAAPCRASGSRPSRSTMRLRPPRPSHLAALGHERISRAIGPRRYVPTDELSAGFHAALAGAGLPGSEELVCETLYGIEGGHAAASSLLDAGATGIVCASDRMALGAIRALREAGLDVPDDVSVVGFDDAAPTPTSARRSHRYSSPSRRWLERSCACSRRTAWSQAATRPTFASCRNRSFVPPRTRRRGSNITGRGPSGRAEPGPRQQDQCPFVVTQPQGVMEAGR